MATRKKSTLKTVVLGDAFVGKTVLTNQYVNKTFTGNYDVTIGVDILFKEVVFNDRKVTIEVARLELEDTVPDPRSTAIRLNEPPAETESSCCC